MLFGFAACIYCPAFGPSVIKLSSLVKLLGAIPFIVDSLVSLLPALVTLTPAWPKFVTFSTW